MNYNKATTLVPYIHGAGAPKFILVVIIINIGITCEPHKF